MNLTSNSNLQTSVITDCNMGFGGQIHLLGNRMRRHDSGFKLSIFAESPAVHTDLHSLCRQRI